MPVIFTSSPITRLFEGYVNREVSIQLNLVIRPNPVVVMSPILPYWKRFTHPRCIRLADDPPVIGVLGMILDDRRRIVWRLLRQPRLFERFRRRWGRQFLIHAPGENALELVRQSLNDLP